MSVLVKGMEMPKTCNDCPLLDWDLSYIKCGVVNRKFEVYEEHFRESRVYDCPLIEIPPHARLIDMDDFLQECSELEPYRMAMELCEVIEAEPCNDLAKPNNAPTIIPADGGET